MDLLKLRDLGIGVIIKDGEVVGYYRIEKEEK